MGLDEEAMYECRFQYIQFAVMIMSMFLKLPTLMEYPCQSTVARGFNNSSSDDCVFSTVYYCLWKITICYIKGTVHVEA